MAEDRCCAAVLLCSALTCDPKSYSYTLMSNAADSVDSTERVQLQLYAKLVAIQTEARPAVQSTQPANALDTLCAIHSQQLSWCCVGRECNGKDMCVCFITAGPITKLCAWGEEESGGHVL